MCNNVFMEYNKKKDGSFEKMEKHNIDVGFGFERLLYIMNNQKTTYETELFQPIIKKIGELSNIDYYNTTEENTFSFRVVADHLRSATFILGDDKAVTPSNVDQGYVLRRIIRRAMRHLRKLNINNKGIMNEISKVIVDNYCDVYPELKRNEEFIYTQLSKEEETFNI